MKESVVEILGASVRVQEAGAGQPVLFLHGAGGQAWSPALEALSAHYRVLAPEHPGFGRSPLPDWLQTVGDLSFFYLDFISALQLDKIHLVGHSLGGWTAAEIAIRNTTRLATLSLLAPAGVRGAEPFGDIFGWSPEEAARRGVFNKELGEKRAKAAATADPAQRDHNRRVVERLAFEPLLHNPQLPVWLHRIDKPTLIVWGEEDQNVPLACAKPYQQGISQAKLVTLKETGHSLPAERPNEVGEILQSFFAESP